MKKNSHHLEAFKKTKYLKKGKKRVLYVRWCNVSLQNRRNPSKGVFYMLCWEIEMKLLWSKMKFRVKEMNTGQNFYRKFHSDSGGSAVKISKLPVIPRGRTAFTGVS